MGRLASALSLSPLLAVLLLALAAPAAADTVYADVDGDTVVLGNRLVHRTWSRAAFGTTEMVDERTGLRLGASADFALELADGASLSSRDMTATDVRVDGRGRRGLAVTFVLAPASPRCRCRALRCRAGTIERTYTLWPDVAGFQVDTALALPGAYTDYTLDAVAVPGAVAAAHHFNAGYDWRGSDSVYDWQPTVAPFAGSHAGSGPPRHHDRRGARRHRAVAQPRHRRRSRHDVGPARVPGPAARELRLLARRL